MRHFRLLIQTRESNTASGTEILIKKTFNKRLQLLSALDKNFDQSFGTKETQAYSDVYKNSVNFMQSKDLEAFDLTKENSTITKLYSKDRFSQSCLLAARLAEKGRKIYQG